MKEIGGYLGLEEYPQKVLHSKMIAVNSARNALVYISRVKKIKKLYLPDYLCDSVYRVCQREGIPYEQYPVSADFLPLFEKQLRNDEYLYIVNYFGQIEEEQAKYYQQAFGGKVILDNVQAFFQEPIEGMDTIYSCRKFFGVPDGGYLATDASVGLTIPVDYSSNRMKHILGRYEGTASEYYEDFRRNDELFYGLELRSMSRLTKRLMGAIDYDRVRKKREENYKLLDEKLNKFNRIHVRFPPGPYAYPFYSENGPTVRKELAKKKIYIPTLWPDAIIFGGIAKEYSENILPLPVDQRYDSEDMNRMMEELGKCMNI